MKPPPDPHYRHRFPAEMISHAVWLYHVFSLSLRDVELLPAERGSPARSMDYFHLTAKLNPLCRGAMGKSKGRSID
jgi:hypothetical protein